MTRDEIKQAVNILRTARKDDCLLCSIPYTMSAIEDIGFLENLGKLIIGVNCRAVVNLHFLTYDVVKLDYTGLRSHPAFEIRIFQRSNWIHIIVKKRTEPSHKPSSIQLSNNRNEKLDKNNDRFR